MLAFENYNSQLKDINKTLVSVNIKDLDREANDDFKIVFVERTEQITTTSNCLLSKDLAKIPDKKTETNKDITDKLQRKNKNSLERTKK